MQRLLELAPDEPIPCKGDERFELWLANSPTEIEAEVVLPSTVSRLERGRTLDEEGELSEPAGA